MRGGWLLVLLGITACPGPQVRPTRVTTSLVPAGTTVQSPWVRQQVLRAGVELREALARDGADAHLRLRLRTDELQALWTTEAFSRTERFPLGISPSPVDRRWTLYQSLADTPIVGFCARGVRIVQGNGAEGYREGTLLIDRLLVVGEDPGGLWGSWLEALVLTRTGWRFLPSVSWEQQIEAPRRDHADVQLWDCDLGSSPVRGRPLDAQPSS